MQWIKLVEDTLNKPPIPYEPAKHSLKAWAQYCLRDRGFKLVYTDKADFAIEMRGGEKVRLRITESDCAADAIAGCIVRDPTTGSVKVTPPETTDG